MVLKKSFLVVLLMRTISLFSQALASDVESAEVLEGKAHKLLQEFYKQGKFRGTVLVAKEDEVLFEGSYGLSNIEARSPNRAVTKFRIASLTKQFTAAAILKLAEQGLVDLQKSIRTYLPNWECKEICVNGFNRGSMRVTLEENQKWNQIKNRYSM